MDAGNAALGTTYQPFGRDLENPYPFYAQARHEAPVTFSPMINAYLVTRYDDIRAMLAQPDVFSSKDTLTPAVTIYPSTFAELSKGYMFVPSAINSDGDNHRRFREPLQKAFAPPRIRVLESLIRQTVTRLIDSFIDQGHAEIISQLAYPMPLEIVLTLLGIPHGDLEEVKRLCVEWNALLFSPLSEEQQLACAKSVVAFHHYLGQLIQDHKDAPREDLLSDLIETRLPGAEPLNDAELVYTLAMIIIAGHETTTRLIGNGLVLLLEEPARWQTICEHPEQIPLVIEEILRYHGPVRGFMRTAMREVTFEGVMIPEGARLFLLYSSANRDETHFSHADEFEMQRRPNQHLAFGYGDHFCVGAPLGRLEGRIAFETLAQRLPGLRLAPNQQLSHVPDLINYGYQRVEVQW